jgi:hypothetical protein
MSEGTYTPSARVACRTFPDSDIEAAIHFCQQHEHLRQFMGTSNDRLVKMGRSMRSLLDLLEGEPLELSLELLAQESQLLVDDSISLQVPRVRFGKTELQMPIVTLGCMRFQQEWGPRITNMNMVGSDCQDNLVEILKLAILKYGMIHIETARGYGSSELQLGCALKQLFLTTDIKREDLIIQVKVRPMKSVIEFRETIGESFQNLQIDYCDLFSLHGFNYEEQMKWVFGEEKMTVVQQTEKKSAESNDEDEAKDASKQEAEETCMSVLTEYMEAGKIKHLGFTTHGPTELICRLVAKDVFSYANIHYHYFGSYTATGGPDGKGNDLAVKMMQERGMGIFIISPFDKGGALYKPSKKLRSLTLPDMEPINFGMNWIWNHDKLADGNAQLHTFTIGAGRPSDLDNAAVAAYLHKTRSDDIATKTKAVVERLDRAKTEALGKDFADHWWKGLPKAYQCKSLVEHNQIVWIYTVIKAYGMLEFGKMRYASFENNSSKWNPTSTAEENIEKNIGKDPWGFVPGLALDPKKDYADELVGVPEENKLRVRQAQECVIKWCSKDPPVIEPKKSWPNIRRMSNMLSRKPKANSSQAGDSGENGDGTSDVFIEEDFTIKPNWETSYDMRPWPDYPDQPKRE